MLSNKEKDALTGEDIVLSGKVVGEYYIYLEWENDYQTIRFRISERPDGRFDFEQSHYIKTPDQASHYSTSKTTENTVDYALKRAVGTIMDYYTPAVKKGLTPNKKWFVANKGYY